MSLEPSSEALKVEEVSDCNRVSPPLVLFLAHSSQTRFTGDGADLVLIQWLRHAEQAIEALPSDSLLPHIQPLHAFFLKILLPSLAPTLPKPGRPIRHLVTRCIVKLHKKVESRSLFDFTQALMKGVADGGNKGMSAGENVARVACWFCIGEVIKELGTNVSVRRLFSSFYSGAHTESPNSLGIEASGSRPLVRII